MKQTISPSTQYTTTEEWLNTLSHGAGFVAAIVGLVYMLLRAESVVAITASAVYGSTLILMFLASTIYHAITHAQTKKWLKLFDHSAIYLLIAGTYTPFTLLAIGGTLGVVATAVIWVLAIGGVVFKCAVGQRFPKIAVTTYLILGWIAVLLIYPLYLAVPGTGLWLMIGGGVCFSVGVMFYVAKSKRYTHAIWHLFVLAGCSFHYFSIYYFVV